MQLLVGDLREAAAIGVGRYLDSLSEQCLDERGVVQLPEKFIEVTAGYRGRVEYGVGEHLQATGAERVDHGNGCRDGSLDQAVVVSAGCVPVDLQSLGLVWPLRPVHQARELREPRVAGARCAAPVRIPECGETRSRHYRRPIIEVLDSGVEPFRHLLVKLCGLSCSCKRALVLARDLLAGEGVDAPAVEHPDVPLGLVVLHVVCLISRGYDELEPLALSTSLLDGALPVAVYIAHDLIEDTRSQCLLRPPGRAHCPTGRIDELRSEGRHLICDLGIGELAEEDQRATLAASAVAFLDSLGFTHNIRLAGASREALEAGCIRRLNRLGQGAFTGRIGNRSRCTRGACHQ